MRKLLPGTFQDFNFDILKTRFLGGMSKCRLYLIGNLSLLRVSGSPSRVRLCRSCLRRFGDLRKTRPWIFGTCICWIFVFSERFQGPLVKNSKYGSSVRMTMPVRRASKFSAKRRAALLPIFFQSLISLVIPGIVEPWPECQPEESRPPEGRRRF